MGSVGKAIRLFGIHAGLFLCACSSAPTPMPITIPVEAPRPRRPVSTASAASVQIDQIRKSFQLPSLAIAEFQDGRMVEAGFSGLRKLGAPARIQPDDQFHLGSCTKAMTATLIGMLVEEGRVFWNEPLSEIFPDMKMDPAFRDVTVEMLSSHRGGISARIMPLLSASLWRRLEDPALSPTAGRALFARAVLGVPPEAKPGLRYIYGNGGYVVLGAIIDRVSGMSWESFIQERLFTPLRMQSCGFGPPGTIDAEVPDQPWGHVLREGKLVPVAPNFQGDYPPFLNSAARVHCSLPDWAKFLQMHSDGFNGKKELLLEPQSFVKLHTPYPGQEYTYGGWIRMEREWAGGPVLTHRGSNTFSSSQVWIGPLKNLIFVGASGADNQETEAAMTESMDYLLRQL